MPDDNVTVESQPNRNTGLIVLIGQNSRKPTGLSRIKKQKQYIMLLHQILNEF